jgi:hypothetical protein
MEGDSGLGHIEGSHPRPGVVRPYILRRTKKILMIDFGPFSLAGAHHVPPTDSSLRRGSRPKTVRRRPDNPALKGYLG